MWCVLIFEIPFQDKWKQDQIPYIWKHPNVNKIKFHIETISAALWNGDASSHVRHLALKLDHHRRSQQTKVFFVKKN